MTKDCIVTPGTVSNILWHFTGGPMWDSERKKQSNHPKPPSEAYANLKSILKTQEVRLGSYKEIIHVSLPPIRVRNRRTGKTRLMHRETVTIESSPVCCLADIPSPHLGYHARRYGKFAIGFHRHAVVRAGFNPVFYTLYNAPTLRSIYKGFAAINRANVDRIREAVDGADSELSALDDETCDTLLAFSGLDDVRSEADLIGKRVATAQKSLSDFVAFVKTFGLTEFKTIYCEREWRSTNSFEFSVEDIAMVVLPRKIGQDSYFQRFVEKSTIGCGLPRGLSVVAWEDLVES